MHEYSVISALFTMCLGEMEKHGKTRILKVKIEVGERSGVEINLLKSAFEVFKKESENLESSELEIVLSEVKLHCESCNNIFSAKNLEYGICPNCADSKVKIVAGTELQLLSIEME